MVVLGIAGLVSVRLFERQWFYDPFLSYFKGIEAIETFPYYEWMPLIWSHLLRMALNLLFSAVIIQFLFHNKAWTLQGCVLILLVFGITFPIYLYCVSTEFSWGLLFGFYVRRFVIQPLVLLLIIPLFYYRKFLLKSQKP